MTSWRGAGFLRLSAHIYNTPEDYEDFAQRVVPIIVEPGRRARSGNTLYAWSSGATVTSEWTPELGLLLRQQLPIQQAEQPTQHGREQRQPAAQLDHLFERLLESLSAHAPDGGSTESVPTATRPGAH